KVEEIIAQFREEFPNTLLMADTGDLNDVKEANRLGFDIIGTTMHGYTPTTKGMNIADNDFEYLKEVLKVAEHPVIAEGKIDLPQKAKRVLELGVQDRKSTRLNSSHVSISYAVFCL